jgi:hypothetical protein
MQSFFLGIVRTGQEEILISAVEDRSSKRLIACSAAHALSQITCKYQVLAIYQTLELLLRNACLYSMVVLATVATDWPAPSCSQCWKWPLASKRHVERCRRILNFRHRVCVKVHYFAYILYYLQSIISVSASAQRRCAAERVAQKNNFQAPPPQRAPLMPTSIL